MFVYKTGVLTFSGIILNLLFLCFIQQPKYIGNLLKFAEVRKKEEERRVERQVQKEREDEGNEFANKDAFVTSAYPFLKLSFWFQEIVAVIQHACLIMQRIWHHDNTR